MRAMIAPQRNQRIYCNKATQMVATNATLPGNMTTNPDSSKVNSFQMYINAMTVSKIRQRRQMNSPQPYRLPGMVLVDHTIDGPRDHAKPLRRGIGIFARKARDLDPKGAVRLWLPFLQSSPGFRGLIISFRIWTVYFEVDDFVSARRDLPGHVLLPMVLIQEDHKRRPPNPLHVHIVPRAFLHPWSNKAIKAVEGGARSQEQNSLGDVPCKVRVQEHLSQVVLAVPVEGVERAGTRIHKGVMFPPSDAEYVGAVCTIPQCKKCESRVQEIPSPRGW